MDPVCPHQPGARACGHSSHSACAAEGGAARAAARAAARGGAAQAVMAADTSPPAAPKQPRGQTSPPQALLLRQPSLGQPGSESRSEHSRSNTPLSAQLVAGVTSSFGNIDPDLVEAKVATPLDKPMPFALGGSRTSQFAGSPQQTPIECTLDPSGAALSVNGSSVRERLRRQDTPGEAPLAPLLGGPRLSQRRRMQKKLSMLDSPVGGPVSSASTSPFRAAGADSNPTPTSAGAGDADRERDPFLVSKLSTADPGLVATPSRRCWAGKRNSTNGIVRTRTGRVRGRYRKGRLLGEGATGKVYEAHDQLTGEFVALKEIASSCQRADVIREIETLQTLQHPNIVRYIDCTEHRLPTGGTRLLVYMELVDGGSLLSLVQEFGSLTEAVLQHYVPQIVDGLRYLHRRGVVHSDIKPANLLVTTGGVVKVADFGASKRLMNTGGLSGSASPQRRRSSDSAAPAAHAGASGSTDASPTAAAVGQFVGTPAYASPESVQGHNTYASDVWEMGMAIYELATGDPPWKGTLTWDNSFELLRKVVMSDVVPRLPESLSPLLRDFLRQCLMREPRARASLRELAGHAFLTTVDNPAAAAASPLHAARSFFNDQSGQRRPPAQQQTSSPVPPHARLRQGAPPPTILQLNGVPVHNVANSEGSSSGPPSVSADDHDATTDAASVVTHSDSDGTDGEYDQEALACTVPLSPPAAAWAARSSRQHLHAPSPGGGSSSDAGGLAQTIPQQRPGGRGATAIPVIDAEYLDRVLDEGSPTASHAGSASPHHLDPAALGATNAGASEDVSLSPHLSPTHRDDDWEEPQELTGVFVAACCCNEDIAQTFFDRIEDRSVFSPNMSPSLNSVTAAAVPGLGGIGRSSSMLGSHHLKRTGSNVSRSSAFDGRVPQPAPRTALADRTAEHNAVHTGTGNTDSAPREYAPVRGTHDGLVTLELSKFAGAGGAGTVAGGGRSFSMCSGHSTPSVSPRMGSLAGASELPGASGVSTGGASGYAFPHSHIAHARTGSLGGGVFDLPRLDSYLSSPPFVAGPGPGPGPHHARRGSLMDGSFGCPSSPYQAGSGGGGGGHTPQDVHIKFDVFLDGASPKKLFERIGRPIIANMFLPRGKKQALGKAAPPPTKRITLSCTAMVYSGETLTAIGKNDARVKFADEGQGFLPIFMRKLFKRCGERYRVYLSSFTGTCDKANQVFDNLESRVRPRHEFVSWAVAGPKTRRLMRTADDAIRGMKLAQLAFTGVMSPYVFVIEVQRVAGSGAAAADAVGSDTPPGCDAGFVSCLVLSMFYGRQWEWWLGGLCRRIRTAEASHEQEAGSERERRDSGPDAPAQHPFLDMISEVLSDPTSMNYVFHNFHTQIDTMQDTVHHLQHLSSCIRRAGAGSRCGDRGLRLSPKPSTHS